MRYEKKLAYLVPFILAIAFVSCKPAAEAPDGKAAVSDVKPLRIGYMICDGIEETRARFEPLTQFLQAASGISFQAVYLNTFEVPEAFERGELDIVHSNSLLYVIMHEKGLEPLAGEKRGSLGYQSAGGIVVRADSSIKTLADLAGKRMVFGPQLAPTGFLSQYELLIDAGVDPELDLEYYAIPWGAYKHEKVVYGVWLGVYDAAAVPLLDLEFMIRDRRIGPEDLRVIARGDPIPYCVFGVSPEVPSERVDKIRSLLFNLLPEDTASLGEEVLSVLGRAQVDGFVPIADSDFDRVREMARKANMPPYQEF
ncbi:MAG: phosphate/phosphite/phosphonate ABC transporter substrate-binding protein [bacterium]|nr:phosphate/phosphite/phosphonate ABC transporter substrate-binding protein [bacterium]MDT8367273.1 phosphate/phosphite/phosphonate ABC transporter substrate-binding protein [bacterium]